jgi:hypothetical protein
MIAAMKILLATAFWFLGAWFVYDLAAFAFGLPRSATPLVAASIAVGISSILRVASAPGSPTRLMGGSAPIDGAIVRR